METSLWEKLREMGDHLRWLGLHDAAHICFQLSRVAEELGWQDIETMLDKVAETHPDILR